MTENHRAFGVTALIAAVFTVSCGSGASTETSPAEQPSSAPSTIYTPSSTPFTVYTHCGVENVRIDGRWWHATPPLYNKSRSGPPTGWGDPHQEGALTMESADRAVFMALGQEIVFVPAPDNEPVRMCD